MTNTTQLKQRSDYTHKPNLKTGRHGWLRLTPAYSVKVVEEIIEHCGGPMRIFDPFCGTATTVLSAAYHGHEAVTTDINPFLIWLGRSKTTSYSFRDIAAARSTANHVIKIIKENSASTKALLELPPIHNIERWWSSPVLEFLCGLKSAIKEVTEAGTPERNLLLISFCRTLISKSNASFNHQSMSFKDDGQYRLNLDEDLALCFMENLNFVLVGAGENPAGDAKVLLGDSRNSAGNVEGVFDRIITSPPYANRMSYIRELRPYMYWLDFLTSGKDAGELDWSAIGGTWGVATSRLADWRRPENSFNSKSLLDVSVKISHADNKNGILMSNYVVKYFEDMWTHFQGIIPILNSGSEIHYIVGNSTFYGILLPTEQYYAEMLSNLGFTNVKCVPLRKRNSKKELIEFDVIATWR